MPPPSKAILASCCLVLAALPAAAQDAFNTFYTPVPSQFIYELRGTSMEFPNRLAWRFTAQTSGPVSALAIAAYRSSGTSTAATLSIYQANGTLVGPLLGSVPFNLAAGQFAPPIVIVPAQGAGITLVAGQDYFFALSVPANVNANWWLYGPPFTPGPQAFWVASGPWQYFSDPQVYYPGFRITTGAACYANCDASTVPPILNVLDFNCFLNRFAAGDPAANCDGSTVPPILNVLDFNCFLNAFAAGCP